MIYEAQCLWAFPPFHQKCTKRKTNWQGKDEVALQSSLQPVRWQRLVIRKDVFLVLMCMFHHPSRWISLNDLLFCALRFFSGFSRPRQIGSYFKRHAWIWMRNPHREKDDRILGISWSWRADIPDTIHTLIDNPKACCKKKCKIRSEVHPHDSVFNVCLISQNLNIFMSDWGAFWSPFARKNRHGMNAMP